MITRLLPSVLLAVSSLALAKSPGPTDPSGPRLDPAQVPAPAVGRESMDEQIRRGTLITPHDEVEGSDSGDPDTGRPSDSDEHRRQPQPLEHPR